jgi:eukaryotic-like serine/threonine-protein kinase
MHDRHRRLTELYAELVDLAAAEREDRLRALAMDDPGLADEARSLLEESEGQDDLLATSGLSAPLPPADPAVLRGERSYRLLREIGRGGMSVVYLAERADGEYRQRVAVKLLRPFIGPEARRRFRSERQILAHLAHPQIAKLLDGGSTADGLPFLVMEHVEGQPLDQYCEARGLPTPARLELFRSVCLAVQYAHQKLVVHRDLKPANILVAADGSPRLLDFGIARILDPELRAPDGETTRGAQPFTPAYASPEQIRGDAVGTASDVYSLGVVLFRLLTTRLPYRLEHQTPSELSRVVCEQEPERPSQVLRGARGDLARDLDAIVLKALRKEPAERYGSAAELAADVEACLKGRPVAARAGSAAYRVRKFGRRHAATLAAGALALGGLLAGLAGSVHQARVATRRFDDLRALANSFLFEFHDAIAPLPGSTPARALVVSRALHYLDRLAQEAGHDPALQRELGTAYHRVANVQGNPFQSNLGDVKGALQSCRKALALRQPLAARQPGDVDLQAELAASRIALGDLLSVSGDKAGARAAFEEVVASLAATGPPPLVLRERLAAALSRLGDLRREEADPAGALVLYERAIAGLGAPADGDPATAEARRALALAHAKRAQALQARGQLAAALADMEQARRLHARLAEEAPDDTVRRRDLMIVEARLGDLAGNPAQQSAGQPERAVEAFERALAAAERLAGADPLNARAQRDLAVSCLRLTTALQAMGRTGEALRHAQRAESVFQRLSAADPTNLQLRRDVTVAAEHAGIALLQAGDVAGALRTQEKALRVREELSRADPSSRLARLDVCWSLQSLGDALLRAGRAPAALDHYRRALGILASLEDAEEPALAAQRAQLLVRSGDAQAELAQRAAAGDPRAAWRAADEAYRRAAGIAADLEGRRLLTFEDRELPARARAGLARCRRALGATAGT